MCRLLLCIVVAAAICFIGAWSTSEQSQAAIAPDESFECSGSCNPTSCSKHCCCCHRGLDGGDTCCPCGTEGSHGCLKAPTVDSHEKLRCTVCELSVQAAKHAADQWRLASRYGVRRSRFPVNGICATIPDGLQVECRNMIGGYGYKVFFRAIDDNATDISAYEHCAQMGVCSKERKVIDESGYFISKLSTHHYDPWYRKSWKVETASEFSLGDTDDLRKPETPVQKRLPVKKAAKPVRHRKHDIGPEIDELEGKVVLLSEENEKTFGIGEEITDIDTPGSKHPHGSLVNGYEHVNTHVTPRQEEEVFWMSEVCDIDCHNGGVCIAKDKCDCPEDKWTGPTCEIPVCGAHGCQNGGHCVAPGECDCLPGFKGTYCEEAMCHPLCINGEVCLAPNVCGCKKGWTGAGCLDPVCEPECQNGGKCVAPNPVKCSCPEGFQGQFCEQPVCKNPCPENAYCSAPDVCTCKEGWIGNNCEMAICEEGCTGSSVCVGPNTCACPEGYTGEKCDEPLCSPACKNGGVCASPGQCACADGWEGPSCEKAVCKQECKNGGYCTGPNLCACKMGYRGNDCSKPVCTDECVHGSCIQPDVCSCNAGWRGRTCELAICKKPCLNSGTCSAPDMCSCPAGYEGALCETPVCQQECQNGGRCIKPDVCECVDGFRGLTCEKQPCPEGYTGANCATPVCVLPCLNKGTCSAPDTCTCPEGLSGKQCEVSVCSQECKEGAACFGDGLCQRRVVAYSAHGRRADVVEGLLANARDMKKYYPLWEMHVYTDGVFPAKVLKEVETIGQGQVKVITAKRTMVAMPQSFWTLTAAAKSDVDVVIFRDPTTRFSWREVEAVDAWIASGKAAHVMRDLDTHDSLITPTAWGARPPALLEKLDELASRWYTNNRGERSPDIRKFLAEVVWPQIKDKVVQHDSFHCEKYDGSVPFPSRRRGNEAVGVHVNVEGNPRMDMEEFWKTVNIPEACRGEKDWYLG